MTNRIHLFGATIVAAAVWMPGPVSAANAADEPCPINICAIPTNLPPCNPALIGTLQQRLSETQSTLRHERRQLRQERRHVNRLERTIAAKDRVIRHLRAQISGR